MELDSDIPPTAISYIILLNVFCVMFLRNTFDLDTKDGIILFKISHEYIVFIAYSIKRDNYRIYIITFVYLR